MGCSVTFISDTTAHHLISHDQLAPRFISVPPNVVCILCTRFSRSESVQHPNISILSQIPSWACRVANRKGNVEFSSPNKQKKKEL